MERSQWAAQGIFIPQDHSQPLGRRPIVIWWLRGIAEGKLVSLGRGHPSFRIVRTPRARARQSPSTQRAAPAGFVDRVEWLG